MLKISKTKISLTRGDSAYITIGIFNDDKTEYVLNDGDTVQLQVRTAPNVGDLVIDATLDNGKLYFDEEDKLIWHIVPADTNSLSITNYYYDVQLVTSSGDVFTFIENSIFRLTDEDTWYE